MANATTRLDYRVPPEVKDLIKQAAALCGLTETGFAVATLTDRARQVVQDQAVTKLSLRDWAKLNAMLQSDGRPGTRLRAAGRRYRKARR